jgi:TonB family protein
VGLIVSTAQTMSGPMAMNRPMARNRPKASGADLGNMFGVAALVVLLSVVTGWIGLKTGDRKIERDVSSTVVTLDNRELVITAGGSQSLIDMAEFAFAAGRIFSPEFDSALGYYQAALDQNRNDPEALAGIDRVVSYLMSQAESAIFQNDWNAARTLAGVIVGVQPDNMRAGDIVNRANRFQRVQQLTETALEQFSRGRLAEPRGANAAETYLEILKLDPKNAAALQGLNTVTARLIANAQSAVIAGETARAERLIEQARRLDPNATGLADVERSARQTQRAEEDQRNRRDLIAASEALQQDRLMPPEPDSAFELFRRVLDRSPGSEAPRLGIQLVQAALVDRARARLAAGEIGASQLVALDAARAGLSGTELEELRAEIAMAERLADARDGRFDRVYGISELEVVRQVAPEYPRMAVMRHLEGWATVEFTVTESGVVRDSRVVESSSGVFDRPAIVALDRWRFKPVLEDGVPMPVRASVRFTFRP